MQRSFKDNVQEISDKVFNSLIGDPSIQLYQWPAHWETKVVEGLIDFYGRYDFVASLAIQNDKESAVLIGTVEDEVIGDDVTVRMVLSTGNNELIQIVPDNMVAIHSRSEAENPDNLQLVAYQQMVAQMLPIAGDQLKELFLAYEKLLPNEAIEGMICGKIHGELTHALHNLDFHVEVTYDDEQKQMNLRVKETHTTASFFMSASRLKVTK